MPEPHDFVRVHNDGDANLTVVYNSQTYTIPVGGDALLPQEAACKDFGDWSLRGKDREKEYRRLRGLYGALDGIAGDNERWEKNQPKVRILGSDGEQVVSVIDDPKGEGLSVVGAPLEVSQEEIQRLLARVETLESERRGDRAEMAVGQVMQDTPEAAPKQVKRRPPTTPFRETSLEA